MYGLARYIGAGTDAEPFRPQGSDQPGWSAIDLRPDGGATLDGGGLNACLLHTPRVEPGSIPIGADPDERLGTAARTALNARLGLALPSGLTVRTAIAQMLTAPPARGWKPLRPTRNGLLEIWLGGLLWTARVAEREVPALLATFTDDFNRADNADLGGNWDPSATDVDRHCIITSNAAEPYTYNSPCMESVNAIAPGGAQFATITIGALSVTAGQDTQLGATIRGTVGTQRNFYYAWGELQGSVTTSLAKRVAGANTLLQSENATTWATADTLKLSGSGTTLAVQRNGAGTLLTITDSAFASGVVGIFLFRTGSGDIARIESFTGGDIAAAAAVPQAAYHYAMHRGA